MKIYDVDQIDFFFNDTTTTEIYTLSLHDALPIWRSLTRCCTTSCRMRSNLLMPGAILQCPYTPCRNTVSDRKSTRLNSSHANISYAVFCLKKHKNIINANIRYSVFCFENTTTKQS